jgi:hypothetical protein
LKAAYALSPRATFAATESWPRADVAISAVATSGRIRCARILDGVVSGGQIGAGVAEPSGRRRVW